MNEKKKKEEKRKKKKKKRKRNACQLIVSVTSLIARIHETTFKDVEILLARPVYIGNKSPHLTRSSPSHSHTALAYGCFYFGF